MIARRVPAAATLILMMLAACDEPVSVDGSGVPQTAYITVKRPWLPGERDSLIAAIQAARQWNFPYVGDLSDYAAAVLPADSVDVIVPNPELHPDYASPFGPVRPAPQVPGGGWSTIGIDVRMINLNPAPDDTLRWLGWFWYNNTNNAAKGLALGFRDIAAGNTLAATTVNTTSFDAAFGKSGAGAGEVSGNPPGNTYWQGNGWVRRNTVSVSANATVGGASAVTTGPFLGGTQQNLVMSGVLDSVRLDRVSGTGNPATQYASITFNNVTGIRYTCVFPTPCTTNTLMAPQVRAWLVR